jgi:vacuolar-type H+-ATPase subunit I/STV1
MTLEQKKDSFMRIYIALYTSMEHRRKMIEHYNHVKTRDYDVGDQIQKLEKAINEISARITHTEGILDKFRIKYPKLYSSWMRELTKLKKD